MFDLLIIALICYLKFWATYNKKERKHIEITNLGNETRNQHHHLTTSRQSLEHADYLSHHTQGL